MVKIVERMYGFVKVWGNEEVLITPCFRCFGGMIVFKKKSEIMDDDLPECGLIVYHIPPSEDTDLINESTQAILRKISACLDFYQAQSFYRCGGNIDTDYNKKVYQLMKKYLEEPIKSLFPNIPLHGVEPDEKTFYSVILFYGNQRVLCHGFEGKELYKDKVVKEA